MYFFFGACVVILGKGFICGTPVVSDGETMVREVNIVGLILSDTTRKTILT